MKCASCGRKSKLVENLCKECFVQNHPLLLGFKPFTIGVCFNCKVYCFEGVDLKVKSLDEALVKVLKKCLKKNKDVEIKSINVKYSLPKHDAAFKVKVKGSSEIVIKGEIQGMDAVEQYDVNFKLKYILCDKCSKKNSGYFEGILQLRNPVKEVEDFIVDEIEKVKTAFITKREEVKNGYDYYLTDNNYLKTLAKKIISKFGGEMKITAKIFTRDRLTMKDVYRVSALVRLFDFKKGDFVTDGKGVFKILKLGKDIVGLDLAKDKNAMLKEEDLEVLKPVKTSVVSVRPKLEVMHPETYQNVAPENSVKGLNIGKEVRVFLVSGKVYLKV